ncbi:PP2C family protein-serine/threonine phosphatase [Streptomyces sp. 4R-3d]|uniref:PP2C family protein-serine/threonine phosphatase n=1 Tax=Streptomyces sp. 4R-3d TaxID=2559605 RepID=UPI00107207CD|nr:PP2C family protein-serine/threonine phosphatase [Streptomyces sp. 4R-3d]TFI25563.1 diguanylate cyclase [Streptomyces sp. 4R-3d]
MNEGRLLKQYEALLGAVPQSVWVLSADGVVSLLRDGGMPERLWHPDGESSWMDAVHPKDRDWFQRAWRRANQERSPLDTIVRVRLEEAPDRFRHIKIIAAPVLDGNGELEWVGTATDAEDHWRTRMREKLLARMAPVPAAHNLSEAFLTTAAAVVPELADAVAVFHVPGDAETAFRPAESIPASPERVGLAPGLPPMHPLDADFLLGPAVQEVIRSQEAGLLTFPPGGPPEDSLSRVSVRWLREAGATSVALLPVVVDGRTVALATTATCRGNPPSDEADVYLLQDVFQQMSGPLRRTIELQGIRDMALVLQQSFLAVPPSVDGLAITALYHPADSAAEVGGDWYDAVRLSDDSLALSIGDIAGHDLDAATAMGRVNSILRGLAYDSGPAASPAVTLSRLDRIVQALDSPSMVTAVHAVLHRQADNAWRIALSNAGHPPPLLIPADAPSRYLHDLTAADPPLCVGEALPRNDLHAVIREGDTLVLYTDGLVEVPGTDIGDGLRHLREQTDALVRKGVSQLSLIRALLPPVQNRWDDIAVIALQARRER